MKLAAFALIFCAGAQADVAKWSYWIQPCGAEAARATHCEAGDVQLAAWALDAWAQASAGRIAIRAAERASEARLRVYWAGGDLRLYGETRPFELNGERGAELFILPDVSALGEQIAAAGAVDKLFRDSIVYLTCLHESGHALGLPHNRNFEDIMYSFQYGGDIVEYFARYRRKLKVREDIGRNSGLSAENGRLIREAK